MFKSIFSRYYFITSIVVLAGVLLLGLVQSVFFTRYWYDEKHDLLNKTATQIASHTADVAVLQNPAQSGDAPHFLLPRTVAPLVQNVADSTECDIMLVDNRGRVVFSSSATQKGELPAEYLEAFPGNAYFTTDFDGLYGDAHYATIHPIIVKDRSVGFVVSSVSTAAMGEFLSDVLKAFFISALAVLALSFVLIYFLTLRLVRPLREMSAATKRFAEGDFSPQITVRGQDEVAELADALNHMAKSLSASEDMSRSFVANISHELRTPMTTIAGFVDGILDGTIPKDQQSHYLSIVSDEVKRLSRLVRAMLDLSRIDNNELRVNPVTFDLTDAVCRTLLSFEPRITEKNVAVEGLEDAGRVMAYADSDLIGQVIYNLLDNAVKFVNDGGTLTVTVAEQDDRAYCAVRNTGVGIPSEEVSHIFERFYKSDKSRSLNKNGVGLGLYIVKSVIALSGGEITVRSEEGAYCEFAFRLPLAKRPAPSQSESSNMLFNQ